MKLTSIEIHVKNSTDIMILSFRDPTRRNAFNIKEITGLDADEILAQPHVGTGSSKEYTLFTQNRNVVFLISLNPRQGEGESHSDLRDAIYKAVSSSRAGAVDLYFKNGSEVVATLSGFVSKIEAPHFARTQEVTLTIFCRDALLKAPKPISIDVKDLNPEYTIISDTRSTAPHGMTYSVKFNSALPELTLSDPDNEWYFGINPKAINGFSVNDILYVSSEKSKYVYVMRNGVKSYVADGIVPGSSWPIIFPGYNIFKFDTFTVSWDEISYFQTYWGV
jgi:hypothetical protein